jgi:hypothetical protein
MHLKCIPKSTKYILLVCQSTNQGFKVEFETKNCWLKFFYSNKVVIQVIQVLIYKYNGIKFIWWLWGSSQVEGIDFNETFPLVAQMESI